MDIEKEYGTYTGILTDDGINIVTSGTELQLYFTINSFGEMIWRMNHDAADGRIKLTTGMIKDLIEAEYSIDFAVLQAKRFGAEISKPKGNERVERTDSYNKWFSWWNDYIQYKLTDDEYKELETLMNSNQDYSEFRPEGTWKS